MDGWQGESVCGCRVHVPLRPPAATTDVAAVASASFSRDDVLTTQRCSRFLGGWTTVLPSTNTLDTGAAVDLSDVPQLRLNCAHIDVVCRHG